MKDINDEEIEVIDEAPIGEEFEKFLRDMGLNELLEDVTLKHTKDRLEALIALADTSSNVELRKNKDKLIRVLDNLKGEKDKRAAVEAMRKIYREYEEKYSNECGDYLAQKELDNAIKNALREYKKYETFKKHEEKIAWMWIRRLSK